MKNACLFLSLLFIFTTFAAQAASLVCKGDNLILDIPLNSPASLANLIVKESDNSKTIESKFLVSQNEIGEDGLTYVSGINEAAFFHMILLPTLDEKQTGTLHYAIGGSTQGSVSVVCSKD